MASKKMTTRDRRTVYKVGDATAITLARVLPGREKAIASMICKSFPDSLVFKVFGEADFAIVQRFKDQPIPAKLRDEYRDEGVIDMQTVTCFSWDGLDMPSPMELAELPATAISFLKVNRVFMNQKGIRGEHLILQAIKSQVDRSIENIHVNIFGTLGWFEMIFMIHGKRMSDVIELANVLRHTVIVTAQETRPCFETTTTFPAVPCINGKIPPGINLGENVSIQTRISCHSWADPNVRSLLQKYLGTPAYVAGTDDYIVKMSRRSLSKYVERLWIFREAVGGKVYRTQTSFLSKGKESIEDLPPVTVPPVDRINIDLDHPRLVQLSKNNPTVHQMFVDIYAMLNSILMDVQRSSAISDLLPFARALLDELLQPEPSPALDYASSPRTLGQQLEMLLFAIRQRCIGIEAYDIRLSSGASYLGGAGGIQRILAALFPIPYTLMKRLNKEWSGFTISGFAQSYHSYLGGVINMPIETLSRPELWFGLFHEMGHEYSSQIDLLNNISLKKALTEGGVYSQRQFYQVDEFYSEIFACIFGFNGDFDECLKLTWGYLITLPEIDQTIRVYLLRFLMVYIFIVEMQTSKYVSKEHELLQLAKELRAKLKRYVPELVEIDDNTLRDISAEACKLRLILDLIRDQMPEIHTPPPAIRIRYKELAEGRVMINIGDPVYFIQNICRRFQKLSYRQAVAIILSLWNAQTEAGSNKPR